MKQKVGSLGEINKIDKSLARLTKKKEKRQTSLTSGKKQDITTDSLAIITNKGNTNLVLYAHTFNNLGE